MPGKPPPGFLCKADRRAFLALVALMFSMFTTLAGTIIFAALHT
jgi:hypothetical protein